MTEEPLNRGKCLRCSQIFEIPDARAKEKRYCSNSCRNKAWAEFHRCDLRKQLYAEIWERISQAPDLWQVINAACGAAVGYQEGEIEAMRQRHKETDDANA